MYDIVYILKNDINEDHEELRYSLRSVIQNFPYKNIWFIGGCPDDIKPDHYIPVTQKGHNKWTKVRGCLEIVCKEPKISEDFWLFNDDFFVMHPVIDCPTAISGTMFKRIQDLMWKNNLSTYAKELYIAKKALEDKKMDTLNYALHIPILINKEKALQTLQTFPNTPMFRCCYGNQHNLAETVMEDVKIHKENEIPTGFEIFLSTSNKSFNHGEAGDYIRHQFFEKCKYET